MNAIENIPLVSVIIPTKRKESTKNQDYKNIEIIVTDCYSTDKTIEIAKSYT
jgi:glycosyltransferase involved in cell wall biosynthesis